MSCNPEVMHPAAKRQPRTMLRRVRGMIERVKVEMTVSVADEFGGYETLIELEAEVTVNALRELGLVR